jgi:hypothetical protein
MAITDELGPAGGGAPFVGLNDDGASSNEAPLFFTDPHDTFFLGTRQLPGECKLQAQQVARIEVNKKKGKGLDGARITLAGYDPREFQVITQITTEDQWDELQDILDVYWRIPGKASTLSQVAISVSHPRLDPLKIHTAVLVGVTLSDGALTPSIAATFTFQEAPYIVKKKNVTKSSGPPARDERKAAAAAKLANETPEPPSSKASNMSTSGPLQSTIPAGAQ